MLAATTGTLWIEETGGIVVRRSATGQILLAYDEARAARAVTNAFALTKTRPRIERVYVYQWRAGATDLFDAGILRPDGSERPSYAALVAATRAPAQTPSPGMTWKARWSGRRLILRGTCAVKPCRGTVTVALRRGTKAIKRYKARTYGTTVRFTVSAQVKRRVNRVALTVRATKPVVASQRVVLKL